MSVYRLLEEAFGWTYFIAWSASFYPQVILIWQRQNASGFSTDFMVINNVGFISYAIFTFLSYFNVEVTKSYLKHTGMPPQVETHDLFFAIHGAMLCILLSCQLNYFPPRTKPKPSIITISCFFLLLVLFGLYLCLRQLLNWWSYLKFTGMVKVLASFVKHFPQVFLNRSRQSTFGYSFFMVILDIIGGTCSLLQQFIRAIHLRSLAPFSSNYAKTFLAVESVLFDLYVMTQHLVWYTDRKDPEMHSNRTLPTINNNNNNESNNRSKTKRKLFSFNFFSSLFQSQPITLKFLSTSNV